MDKSPHPVNDTKRHILEAALTVIAENKISGVNMRDIATQAGISHGTLHYHFPSKSELLLFLLDEIDHIFNEQRVYEISSLDLSPAQKLSWFLKQEEELLQNQRYLAEVFIDYWGQGLKEPEIKRKIQEMYDRWRADIDEAVQEGVSTGSFNAQIAPIIPELLVSIMEGASLQYLIDERAIDLGDHFDTMNRMVLDLLKSRHSNREGYPTDISDDQWDRIAPLFPRDHSKGRPRAASQREIVDAIIYKNEVQCPWRMLPHDFPHWKTVYGYYNHWKKDKTLEKISGLLKMEIR